MTDFGTIRPAGLSEPHLVGTGHSALLTYEPYYGLREKPFSLSADPRFFYKTGSHAPAFEDLLAGIRRREGLVVLTGDIGTGKTTLCRAVLERLDRKTFSAFIPDPFVSREDLLKMLLIDFGVMSVDDLRSGRLTGATRPDLSYPLYEFLNSLVPLQAFAVLILDETQNLSLPLLEEIWILSDLERHEKLLQVVLVGQLEFLDKLRLPQSRQIDQRVSVRCTLEPLSREGVAGYVAHRLEVAGGTPDRVGFSFGALDVVWVVSGGVPRLINRICDRALHRGHLSRSTQVDAATVWAAVGDLGLRAGPTPAAPSPVRPPAASPFADVAADQAAAARRVLSALDLSDLVGLSAAVRPLPAEPSSPGTAPAHRADDAESIRVAMDLGGVMEMPVSETQVLIEPARAGQFDAGAASQEFAGQPAAIEPAVTPELNESATGGPVGDSAGLPDTTVAQGFQPVLAPPPGTLGLHQPDDAYDQLHGTGQRAGRGKRWTLLASLLALVAGSAGLGFGYWRLVAGSQADGEAPTVVYLPPPPPTVSRSVPVFGARWLLDETAAVPLQSQTAAAATRAPVSGQANSKSYIVQVALFASQQRAGRLVDELTQAGFRAYPGVLVLGAAELHQVSVGPYPDQAGAEADCDRIRQIPGYADARVVPAPVASDPAK